MEEQEDKKKRSSSKLFLEHYYKNKSVRTRRTTASGYVYYKRYKEGQKNFRFHRKDYPTVRRILNEEILEEMLNGAILQLPYRLGWLYMYRKKATVMSVFGTIIAPIDFQKTKELGQNVYVDATEFDGHIFRSKWLKKRSDHNSMFFFSFRLTIAAKKKLKEKLSTPNFYKKYRDIIVQRR
jgi:hypothetical protein